MATVHDDTGIDSRNHTDECRDVGGSFAPLLLFLQLLVIIALSVWFEYASLGDEPTFITDSSYFSTSVMMFIGFGMLMCFLRLHAFTALGFTMLITVLALELGCLGYGIVQKNTHLSVAHILNGNFAAAAVLISFGGCIGRLGPTPMLLMTAFEVPLYFLNMYVNNKIGTLDPGGSVLIHTFGAYFGLALSWRLSAGEKRAIGPRTHPLNSSTYSSDMVSLLGTAWLWIYWPAFNSATVPLQQVSTTIVATVLALCGSTAAAFAVTLIPSIARKERPAFDLVQVQNATLAGGVAIGSIAWMPVSPGVTLGVGTFAGIVSVLGYEYLTPFLVNKINLRDTCGIHNLHGMPGLIGSFTSVIAYAWFRNTHDKSSWGSTNIPPPVRQLAGVAATLGIAIVGGLVFGEFLLRLFGMPHVLYHDKIFWTIDDSYVAHIPVGKARRCTGDCADDHEHEHEGLLQ